MIGMMFPGIKRVRVTRKADGAEVILSKADLQAKLPEDKFERLSHEIFMWGEYEDSLFRVDIHEQDSVNWNRDDSFL